ncbi:carboxyltransferase domain-containing protein [Mycobacterium sp. M1]|uniref:Carboxyltransferase domain-containing protein n=1 Tax=Mycolicibacter acidiphilus TaxID=2835306 RepID=A0ABS5RIQ4_9MYCO|nr:carboxyltransferase domain-containing protein [Mycolicibacter acidiphilus]MBS9533346.1 carboxyltransferase domain-containing protein [Mycolicibacter acidiphilus]
MSVMTEVGTDTVLDYGDRGLLLQFDRTAEVLAWTAALRAAELPGVVDVVPASRTVLVKLAAPRYQAGVRRRVQALHVDADAVPALGAGDAATGVVIDVVYDGPDLAEVADYTGLSVAQVINAHTATPWQVGFGGSTPGFAYLIGGDPRLQVPRRAELRPVPAGSVALAGEFSGIYPRQWPGGWRVIGRTDAVLWDLNRPDPALLIPGRTVTFRPA